MPNTDPKRVFDGFKSLESGQDSYSDPALLPANQAAFFGNISLRSNFAKTRPPYIRKILTFDSDQTLTNFAGVFQGACFYESLENEMYNSIIVSIGGRLFRIYVANNFLTEDISPGPAVIVTADFVVPAGGANVTVNVTSEVPFTVGQNLIIDSGTYVVASIAADQITVTYGSGAANATCVAGNGVLNGAGAQIYFDDTNPSDAELVYLYQAENYVIGLCNNQGTLIFDGSTTRRSSVPNNELPSSYVGTYAWGRNWLAQVNGHRFVASDLVGDPSGSSALVYVDAILKMTENDLLSGGGAFSTPANLGKITAMTPLAQLDSSLGLGPVLVGTLQSVFSVQAPVDRTTWQNLTYPIQSVALSGAGPVGPRALLSINSDAWMRSLDGARSLIAARRDFQNNLSNTPNSLEVSPIFDLDDEALLFYSSIANFDNRIFFTASPYWTEHGIAHRGLAVINQDDISSINKQGNAIWEGLWTGLNIFQVFTGNVGGVEHCYAFALNDDGGIDLWEVSPEGKNGVYDIYQNEVSTTNLVPAGTIYGSNGPMVPGRWYLTGLTANTDYRVVWGSNELWCDIGGGTHIYNPGVGETTVFTVGIGQLLIFASSPPNQNILVTAQVYQVTSVPTIHSVPISSWLDTRAMTFGDGEQLKHLIMGELFLDQIVDTVQIKVYFKPDQYPTWTLWTTVNVCANVSQCTFTGSVGGNCKVWTTQFPQYAARITLPRPTDICNAITNRPMCNGYQFQFRFEITGSCRIRTFKVHANMVQDSIEGECPTDATCTTVAGCETSWFGYSSYG